MQQEARVVRLCRKCIGLGQVMYRDFADSKPTICAESFFLASLTAFLAHLQAHSAHCCATENKGATGDLVHASERERMHAKEQEVAKADPQHRSLAHADRLHSTTRLHMNFRPTRLVSRQVLAVN